MKNLIMGLLLVLTFYTAPAQKHAVLTVKQTPSNRFYIEEITFHKLNRINSVVATDISLLSLQLDTVETSIRLPVDDDFTYYRITYVIRDSIGMYAPAQVKGVPVATPFMLLTGDSINITYDFFPGKNSKIAYLVGNVTGDNADLYKSQLEPKVVTDGGETINKFLSNIDTTGFALARSIALAKTYLDKVEETVRKVNVQSHSENLIKEILLADQLAYAMDHVHTAFHMFKWDLGVSPQEMNSLYEEFNPILYLRPFSDKALEQSYYTSNTIYRWLTKKLNTKYYHGQDNIERDVYFSAEDMLNELLLLPENMLRSKLLWESYVTMSALEMISLEQFREKARSMLRVPYDKVLSANANTTDYKFLNADGKQVKLSDFKGKYILMDWWFTGCIGCRMMTPFLEDAKEQFRNDPNIVFVSVNVDRKQEVWLQSLNSGAYTSLKGINLHTGDEGKTHPMLKDFNIFAYPRLFLIDKQGKPVMEHVPDPREDVANFVSYLKAKVAD